MELLNYQAALAVITVLALGLCHCHFGGSAHTEVCLRVPFSVDDCYAASMKHPISPKSAKIDCLQRLMWYYEADQNLTAQDISYFSSLSQTGWSMGVPKPKTGFRVRKEYRQLSDMERQRLHNAFVKLYEKGIMKKYADLHRHAIDSAHSGAAFLSWHRVFIAMFEDELRLEDKTVSLPYWDTTLDENMDNGVNSIIWSSTFLGNANGDVITGPFAGWKTGRGNLWRDYGSHMRGKLTSDEDIKKILTKCNTDDIVFPLNNPANDDLLDYVIEYFHNGVHNWVGGDMSDAAFAAFDPVFYMVHAFVDLQWEMFRKQQKKVCGVNPETDYAVNTGGPGHGPNDPMYGFDGFTNIDGLKNYWTHDWYNYKKRPQCPDCGSKYLYCDVLNNKCVSHSRRTDYNAGQYLQNSWVGQFRLPTEPFEPRTELIPKLIISKFLPSPLSDGRTRESAKRDAKKAMTASKPVSSAYEIQKPVQKTAVPRDGVHSQAIHNKNINNTPLNLNININKHSLPALLIQQHGASPAKQKSGKQTGPGKGKAGNKKHNVVDLFHRLDQHNQQSNQNKGKNINGKTHTGKSRRKYLSFA